MNDIKTLYKKFEMDETRSSEIRSKLAKQKSVSHVWLIPVAAVLTVMIVIMAVPQTRKVVVNAAEKIYKEFCIRSEGEELILGTDPDTGKSFISISFEEGKGGKMNLVQLKEGRLYLDFGDVSIDITDKCSRTDYYRKEILLENGDKGVVLAGGIPEEGKFGAIVCLRRKDTNSTGCMIDLPEGYDGIKKDDFEWSKNALHDEGLPCLDPDCDKCKDITF